MRTHRRPDRAGRARFTLERLESRELLSHVGGPEKVRWLASVIGQLFDALVSKASTVPPNGDVKPCGVAFVPSGFAGHGELRTNDLLVSNFSNRENEAGMGSTIVRITPAGQQSVFYQGPPGIGFSGALDVLRKGYVVAGYVPSTNGTPATAQAGGLLVLNPAGGVVANITNPALLDGPWGMAVADHGKTASLFVSSVLSGTITRLDVKLTTAHGFQQMSSVQIASGYTHYGSQTAFEVGPAGLAFDARTNMLYVASTGDNVIYAISGAGRTQGDQGTGQVVYQDSTYLHGPLGLTLSPDGNLIAAESGTNNPGPNSSTGLIEFTRKGQYVGGLPQEGEQNGVFGVAVSSSGHQFATASDLNQTAYEAYIAPDQFFINARTQTARSGRRMDRSLAGGIQGHSE